MEDAPFYFPHELDTLSFPVESRTIRVTVSLGDTEIVSGTFTGDGGGVTLSGLAPLIRAAQRRRFLTAEKPAVPVTETGAFPYPAPEGSLTVKPEPFVTPDEWAEKHAGDTDPGTYADSSASYAVLPCEADAPCTAAEWISSRFMVPGTAKRMPLHAGLERLYLWQKSVLNVAFFSLRVTWADGGKLRVRESTGLAPRLCTVKDSAGAGYGLFCASFTPAFVAEAPALPEDIRGVQPVSIELIAGDRRFAYYIASGAGNDCYPRPLAYLSAFHDLSTLWCYGDVEEEYKPSYTQAAVGGLTRNAAASVTPAETWHTGALIAEEIPAARDLASSVLLLDGETGEELTLTEAEIKPTNDRTARVSASYTLRRARSGSMLCRPAVTGKVFDYTHDGTFQ